MYAHRYEWPTFNKTLSTTKVIKYSYPIINFIDFDIPRIYFILNKMIQVFCIHLYCNNHVNYNPKNNQFPLHEKKERKRK